MNVTVIASNAYETVSQVVSFEMVGKVKGPLIDDFQIISNKAQEKEFEISFETIGSGSCMVIDFKDGSMKVCWKLGLCMIWLLAPFRLSNKCLLLTNQIPDHLMEV